VSVQQLKLANNLSGNHLRRGQSLMIPTSGAQSGCPEQATAARQPQCRQDPVQVRR
jgi:membrane-bound lytic murein transglycosylase D